MKSEENSPTPVELFDIALTRSVRPGQHVQTSPADPSGSSWQDLGVRLLGLPLSNARQVLKTIRDSGGTALIIPIRYRETRITREVARTLALDEFERVRKPNRVYGEMTEGWDSGLWWEFRVPDIEQEEAGYIPAAVIIGIDKHDGHVQIRGERPNWLRLSEIN